MKHDGVSEVVGALILVSIGVLAMGIVILVLVSGSLPGSVPSFSGFISNSSNTIYISHEGGDPIWRGQYRILVDGVDETWNFTKSITDPFSAGKVMNASLPKMPSRVVMVFNTSGGGGSVLLSADLTKMQVLPPYGWYDISWLYRKNITIDGTKVSGGPHTNFPVLISLDAATSGLNNLAQFDGDDILFTSSDGTTKLSHEIESYSSGTLIAWVKVPSITSGTNTVLYMYYGNGGASSQEDATNVWDTNFKGVWHHDSDLLDATIYGNTGSNSKSQDAAGWINRARQFPDSQSDTYVDVGSADSLDSIFAGGGTVSAWIYPMSWGWSSYGRIADKTSNNNDGDGWSLKINGNSNRNSLRFNRNFTVTTGSWETGNNIILNQWHYVAVTYDENSASDPLLYVNGTSRSIAFRTGPAGSVAPDNTQSIRIGNSKQMGRTFNGIIDEIRLSKTSRSADWILTEYNNQNNPGVGGFLVSISTPQMIISMS